MMVVVTRWYGGIHLGADRFKDINSVRSVSSLSPCPHCLTPLVTQRSHETHYN